MKEPVLFIFIVLGVMSTAGTLWIGTNRALMGVGEEALAAVGILMWSAVALGATNIERITQCCRVVYSEPTLSFAGTVLVVGHIILLLWGTVSLLDVRDAADPQRR